MGTPSVAVVYLAREAEGATAFERFIRSYQLFPSGVQHDLVIIYKGFVNQIDLARAHQAFTGVRHIAIELPDVGYDIGSYIECSRHLSHAYICFLNTYTEIACDGWLTKLTRQAVRQDVGIVGASASYESLKHSWELIQRFYWLYYVRKLRYPNVVDRYYEKFREYLPESPPNRRADFLEYISNSAGRFVGALRSAQLQVALLGFGRYWRMLARPGGALNVISSFPDFPNPHIRSNGFMINRERLSIVGELRIETKDDACRFESGPDNLTARMRRKGLRAIVVGRDGTGYDVRDWPNSKTFRLGNQSNLLLIDKHGRAFNEMSQASKVTHAYMTWGEFLGPPPNDFPTLGTRFKRGSLDPYPARD